MTFSPHLMSITMASANNHTGLPPPQPIPHMGNDAQPPGRGSLMIITRHFSSPGRLQPIESLVSPPLRIQLDVMSQLSSISLLGMSRAASVTMPTSQTCSNEVIQLMTRRMMRMASRQQRSCQILPLKNQMQILFVLGMIPLGEILRRNKLFVSLSIRWKRKMHWKR
jgi:hypothetical protein